MRKLNLPHIKLMHFNSHYRIKVFPYYAYKYEFPNSCEFLKYVYLQALHLPEQKSLMQRVRNLPKSREK